LFLALVGTCAFDDGKLAQDWTDCVLPLGLLGVPFLLAITGVVRRSVGFLTAAAAVGGVVGLVSLTGPGLFVLLPAILYGVGAATVERPGGALDP
jgi:hypothetical protein